MALYLTHNIPVNSESLVKLKVDIRDYHSLGNVSSQFGADMIIHVAALGMSIVVRKTES